MKTTKEDGHRESSWQWALSPLKAQNRLMTIIASSTLVIYATSFAFPLTLQKGIDAALNNNTDMVYYMFTLSILISFFEIFCSNWRLKTIINLGTRLELKLAGKLIRLVLSKKYTEDALLPGDILNATNQIRHIKDFLLHDIPQTILELGQAVISFILIAYFSITIAMLVATSLLINALFVRRYLASLPKETEKYYNLESKKQNATSSFLFSLRPIKCHALENFICKRIIRQSKKTLSSLRDILNTSRLIQLWGTLTSRILTIAVLTFGCLAVSNDHLTLGEFIMLQILTARISGLLPGLSNLLKKFQEIKTSLNQIKELDDLPSENQLKNASPPDGADHQILLQNIRSHHPSNTLALNNISLTLPNTGLIILAGLNGSGKSTLIHTLLGIHEYSSGNIFCFGKAMQSLNVRNIRKNISLVTQDSYLFLGTLRENICCDRDVSDIEILNHLKTVGLLSFVEALPNKLDHLVAEHGENLSGGQKQKICLARALLRGNSLYILDEPTSALDKGSTLQILRHLIKLSDSCLVICVTHDPLIMRAANTVVFMSSGSIAASGPHKELIKSCCAYKTMYHESLTLRPTMSEAQHGSNQRGTR